MAFVAKSRRHRANGLFREPVGRIFVGGSFSTCTIGTTDDMWDRYSIICGSYQYALLIVHRKRSYAPSNTAVQTVEAFHRNARRTCSYHSSVERRTTKIKQRKCKELVSRQGPKPPVKNNSSAVVEVHVVQEIDLRYGVLIQHRRNRVFIQYNPWYICTAVCTHVDPHTAYIPTFSLGTFMHVYCCHNKRR